MLYSECRRFYCLTVLVHLVGLVLLACSSCMLLVSLLLAVLLILVLRLSLLGQLPILLRLLTIDVTAGSFLLRAAGALLLLSCGIQCQVGDGRCSAERLYPIEAILEFNEILDFARGQVLLSDRLCHGGCGTGFVRGSGFGRSSRDGTPGQSGGFAGNDGAQTVRVVVAASAAIRADRCRSSLPQSDVSGAVAARLPLPTL